MFPKLLKCIMLLATAINNGKLVSQQRWKKHIGALRREADNLGFFSSKAAARNVIYGAIAAAIKSRADYCLSHKTKFGVLLSGGVDSSFIALMLKKFGYKFPCFTVGLVGSKDLAASKVAASKLKLKLVLKEFTVAAAEKIIKEAVKLLETDDPVTIGIAATEIAALKQASDNKIKVFFSGLGSEEIFAGYQRHVIAKDAHEESWRGLKAMWKRDFLRDVAVAATFQASALTPFLDRTVIAAAMRAKTEWKIHNGEKKLILREIAAEAGLPKNIAFRPKMAAQYGSGFDKALEKLTKAAGLSNKRDYLYQLLS